ncbi:Trap transporter, 4tm/12tm fusion protein [[Clostridium] ultunense Esp]|uniref:Trap transporter, 4tm/12tm fusion protein n=1 Tax=[Clostridium] ultunense Esp TaxID=1288971 RepID=M1Z502_9FIRM|nr:TRAP transporter permease [Schnuerera ultunensis]CCQ93101.1 Trap transporter, 4tm/12tm fusion protein [[Clostridium] ultunense Esp]SHD77886.1 Trap transporter, 4tm/12tm fusion protein [[Clostridium] ultunense Esp]
MEKEQIRSKYSLITIVSILMAIFHIYTALFGVLTALWQRSIHLCFGMLITFLLKSKDSSNKVKKSLNILLAMMALATVVFFIVDFDGIVQRFSQPNTSDMIIGTILILLTLEFARRNVGNILPGIAIVFLLYAMFGSYLPGILWHRGYDLQRIITQVSLSTEGIFGVSLGVSANFIFIFVLFGSILSVTDIGKFYIDLAIKGVGKTPGGPAKAAVVSSSLFGSISGSAVANVAGTGCITIPLMKSTGYSKEFSGAVEAVASTGGQIMPPMMGAAAFIMAEILGIPYYKVAIGAAIPAVIYFGSVFAMVHFRARRIGLTGIDTSSLPSIKEMLKTKGILLTPLILLIVLLVGVQMSAMKASVYTVLVTLAIAVVFCGMRTKELIDAFEDAAKTSVIVISSTACAGIIVAMINLTGIGLKFSNIMISLAGGNIFVILVLLMLASLLMGMGLPTTPSYLILAVLGAPALIRLGVEPLAAHMFVFYFGCISMITPPVALAVYAATSIAESDFWKTSFEAVKLGITAFIVPYMFVYNPSLLAIGKPITILTTAITAIIGAVILGAGISGWLLVRADIKERILLIISGLFLIDPRFITNLLGLLGLVLVLIFHRKRKSLENSTSS